MSDFDAVLERVRNDTGEKLRGVICPPDLLSRDESLRMSTSERRAVTRAVAESLVRHAVLLLAVAEDSGLSDSSDVDDPVVVTIADDAISAIRCNFDAMREGDKEESPP